MLETLKENAFEYKKLNEAEMKQRGILGRLIGNCADFINPTRNGRKYSEELWEQVFNNPIMKEKFANKVMYGELGHPTDRTEIDIEKVAVCMVEPPKKDKDGHLKAVFDILNTPNGRLLKALCDYGSTVGVSSRGSGEVVGDEVDPETYDCECWDIVLVPSVKEARMQYVTEGLDSKKAKLRQALTESLNKATEEEKKIMKETLNNLNIKIDEKKEEIKEDVNVNGNVVETEEDGTVVVTNKDGITEVKPNGDVSVSAPAPVAEPIATPNTGLTSPSESGDISIQANAESGEAVDNGSKETYEGLKEALKSEVELKKTVKSLQEQLAVSDTKVNELKEECNRFKESTERLAGLASERKALKEKVSVLEKELKDKEVVLESQKARISRLVRSVKASKPVNESLEATDKKVTELNESLVKEKSNHEAEIKKINEELENAKTTSLNQINELTESLSNSKKLVESYKKLATKTISKYISCRADMLGVSPEEITDKLDESYSLDDVDRVCENLDAYNLSINTTVLPVDKKVNRIRVNEAITNSNVAKVTKNPYGDDDEVSPALLKMAGIN